MCKTTKKFNTVHRGGDLRCAFCWLLRRKQIQTLIQGWGTYLLSRAA